VARQAARQHSVDVIDLWEDRKLADLLPLIHSEDDAGKVTLSLPDDLDLPVAVPLVESLRAAFNEYSDIVVIAATVERASTAAVQALVAATRHAEFSGQRFAIAAPSDVLADVCNDLGLAGWLEEWSLK
jgi:chemotaxis protein CheX